jgi:hypothetical protein
VAAVPIASQTRPKKKTEAIVTGKEEAIIIEVGLFFLRGEI